MRREKKRSFRALDEIFAKDQIENIDVHFCDTLGRQFPVPRYITTVR